MNARASAITELPKLELPNMLVIGDTASWTASRGPLPQIDGVVFAHYRDLTAALLRQVDPDFVLSPLIDAGFDAIDVAAELTRLQFCGRYRVVLASVPNPHAILNEVRQAFPMLDFDILIIPERPVLSGIA